MTDPKQSRAWDLDPVGDLRIPPQQAHRAALTVAAADPHDPLIARHLLDVLGLLDLPHQCAGNPIRSRRPYPPRGSEAPQPLIDTAAAAAPLRTTTSPRHRFAQARIVAPAREEPDGTRWWNLPDLRSQIAVYLADNDTERPTFS